MDCGSTEVRDTRERRQLRWPGEPAREPAMFVTRRALSRLPSHGRNHPPAGIGARVAQIGQGLHRSRGDASSEPGRDSAQGHRPQEPRRARARLRLHERSRAPAVAGAEIKRDWDREDAAVRLTAGSIGILCVLSCLSSCGGGSDGGGGGYVPAPPQQVVTHILSDPAYDGDIEQTSATSFTVTQGMSGSIQTVLAGIDPSAGTEFRAFLDFPLNGPDGVPGDAIIDSAFLEVLVDDLYPTDGSLPVRVEL